MALRRKSAILTSEIMNQPDAFDSVFWILLLSLAGWWSFILIRYLVRRFRSRRWPTVDATVQKGAVGRISFGRGASAPASFMGYAYVVQGVRYAGFFALYGDEVCVRKLHDGLGGASLQIRYSPSDPNLSFLVHYSNSRFEGLTATQSPEWLDQAPSFDLQDAIRGASSLS
jgi:hypothetical protein